MSVATIQQTEELGSYLSSQDLSQILAPGLRKASIIKSYFVDPEEDRTNRIMDFVTQLSNIFLEYYPSKLVTETTLQFQRLLPDFLEDYGTSRYFTKNHIANHFLALLDFRLSLVGSKLSPNHIDNVRKLLGLQKGKIFSYFAMKQTQSDLLAAGHIQRKRNNVYTPLLKSRVAQVVNEVIMYFPDKELTLTKLQETAFDLIDERIVPRIDVEDAALVIVSSLLSYYVKDNGLIRAYWVFIENNYKLDIELLKRKIYRYRSLLKKENKNGRLGLGKKVDERGKYNGCTSYNT